MRECMNKSLALSGLLCLALPIFAGCDPVYGVTATIDVPADVQALYSAQSPGLLVAVDPIFGGAVKLGTVCDPDAGGAAVSFPFDSSKIGCPGGPGTLEVWVEPLVLAPGDVPPCGPAAASGGGYESVDATHDGDEPAGTAALWTDARCGPRARNLISDVTVELSLP